MRDAILATILSVQTMLATWPRIEVVCVRGGEEQALPAEQWIELAAGQLLHQALGGVEDFVGEFRYARRVA
jgi:hypothetical protein